MADSNSNQFPRGKLNRHDEGAIEIAVTIDQDCVVLAFKYPVSWVGMPAEQAEELARVMLQKAEQARRARQ